MFVTGENDDRGIRSQSKHFQDSKLGLNSDLTLLDPEDTHSDKKGLSIETYLIYSLKLTDLEMRFPRFICSFVYVIVS